MVRSSLIHLGIVFALFLAACGAYGIFYAIVSAESVQANTLEDQIVSQNNAATELIQAKSDIAQLSMQQGTVDQYFVSTSNIVPFLEQLQSIGTYLGGIVQVASVAAAPGTPYGQINLALTVDGSFNAVARTIGAIEFQPYNVSLTSLTLSTTAGSDAAASSSPEWTAAAAFTVGAETGAPATSTPDAVPTFNPAFDPGQTETQSETPIATPSQSPASTTSTTATIPPSSTSTAQSAAEPSVKTPALAAPQAAP